MRTLWHLWLICIGYALNSYAIAKNSDARLAIIIDDIGYNQSQSERAARLHGAFTLSVLPFTPHGLTSAELAYNNGKELMLHVPMSNINNLPLGRGGLLSGMEKAAFLQTIHQDIENIPHIQGVNNHMGSRLTQEAEPMSWLMEALGTRGLYFVDSRTSTQTKAFDIARAHQIPSLKRDVFLDDVNEQGAIELQLNRAIQFAQQRGTAVAIGHPYPATLDVLERMHDLLEKQQVRLVYASQLLAPLKIAPKLLNIPNFLPKELPYCSVPSEKQLLDINSIVDLYDKTAIIDAHRFGY